jgi:hypothetical protein
MPTIPSRIAAFFTQFNTHGTALAGLAAGGTAIVAAITALFKLLSNPAYLVALYQAIVDSRHHVATQQDGYVFAQLAAACFAILGGFAIGLVSAYLGRPTNIPQKPTA